MAEAYQGGQQQQQQQQQGGVLQRVVARQSPVTLAVLFVFVYLYGVTVACVVSLRS
jgi:hypothetical protein